MKLQLMDCTLRDGANVVGKGFSAELTKMMLIGLTNAQVPFIEYGNAGGIGAYEIAGFKNALSDKEYLKIAQPFLAKSKIGMFLNAKRYNEDYVGLASANGLSFLRVGADAGDGAKISIEPIRSIKKHGMMAFYSLMKAYILTPEQLAEEGKLLEDAGLDQITIMDSAGTMTPDQVAAYTEKLVQAISIPVAFHGHNNLGLSAANAVAAYQNGASMLDCGLMGMARSAGNLATELAVAIMQRYGEFLDIDLFSLLHFIEDELEPAMKQHKYHNPVKPYDIILGFSGCHSSFGKTFKAVAQETNVDLLKLICSVSKTNRKSPSEEEIRAVAVSLKV